MCGRSICELENPPIVPCFSGTLFNYRAHSPLLNVGSLCDKHCTREPVTILQLTVGLVYKGLFWMILEPCRTRYR